MFNTFKWNPFEMNSDTPNGAAYISFGSNSSSSKSVPVQLPNWNAQQQDIASTLFSQVGSKMNAPVPKYPGNMYVPELPEETAYLANASGWANQLAALRANISKPAYEITPETTEQFYQQSIKAPMMQEYKEITEPAIRESYVGSGYWGSARANAEMTGAEHLATTLGAARANLAYTDEQARRTALTEAASRAATAGPGMIGEEANIMGSAGQYARMIDQEQVQGDLQRWLMGEEMGGVDPTQYSPYLTLAFEALGLSPYSYGTYGKSSSSSWSAGILSG